MEARLQQLREFVHDVDPQLYRSIPFEVQETRDSGDKNSLFNMRGYASVYNSWSLDLGGFRERILQGAFDDVLANVKSAEPRNHVLHVWDHDSRFVFSSTKNGTLSLETDSHGLNFYSRVAKTTYAADLRTLVERGDVDEASFAFTVDEDGEEWRVLDDGTIERDIISVSGLYDVTTTAMGAYPASVSALAVRSLASGRSLDAARAIAVTDSPGSNGSFSFVPGQPLIVGGTSSTATYATNTTNVEIQPKPNETRQLSDEEREANEREFKKWQLEREAAYRRTRDFVNGVNDDKDEET